MARLYIYINIYIYMYIYIYICVFFGEYLWWSAKHSETAHICYFSKLNPSVCAFFLEVRYASTASATVEVQLP